MTKNGFPGLDRWSVMLPMEGLCLLLEISNELADVPSVSRERLQGRQLPQGTQVVESSLLARLDHLAR